MSNISSLDGSSLTYAINQVQPVATNSNSATPSVGSVSGGDSSQVSSLASMFQKLQSLQQSDPTQFATVTANIGKELQTAASQQSGPESQALANLASKFQQASSTGSMASLQPQSAGTQGAHGHHHHHHHSASTTTQTSSSPTDGTTATSGSATNGYQTGAAQNTSVMTTLESILSQNFEAVQST